MVFKYSLQDEEEITLTEYEVYIHQTDLKININFVSIENTSNIHNYKIYDQVRIKFISIIYIVFTYNNLLGRQIKWL